MTNEHNTPPVAAPAPAEPFGYFRADALGWTDCAATDEGAIALYERPAAPAAPAAPDVMSILRAIHRRPSDAGIWLDDITRILRDAPAPAVPNVLKRGYGRLIQAAADLALQQFMPSDIVDDYPSKTISAAKVAKMMTQPRDRLRLLSIEVSEGAKQMLAATPATPSQEPAVPQSFQPIETIKYWADAYSDLSSGPHFQGHGMVVTMLREYEQLRTILAATPTAPSQETAVPQGFKPVGYLRSDEFDGHVFEPIDGTWPFDELLFSLSTSPEPVQEVTLTDAVKALDDLQSAFMSHTQWNGTPPSEVIAARAIIAALREKGQV